MASTFVNNLRLNEMATGDESGNWGVVTNLNLDIIGQAFGYGTRALADASTDNITIGDGVLDADRNMYLKLTGGGQACTVSLLPNTASKVYIMENATSATLTFTQGSGANVAILAGEVKMIAGDGLGSGAVVYDLLTDLNLAGVTKVDDLIVGDDLVVGDDLGVSGDIDLEGSIDVNGTANLDIVDIDGAVNMATTALVTGVLTTTAATVFNGGFASNADSTMGTNKKIQFRDAAIHISSSADGQLDLVADTEIQIAATTIDINGAINASGEIIAASLDISGNVDIDGVLETDNLTVGSDQGDDGQVLTSTGSGVAWEDASGGATDIDGLSDAKSGGTNFSNSLFLGHQTTGTLNNANNNTAVGYGAMDAVTAGADSTAIGKDAMTTATTADSSVAVGTSSMAATTTGNDNTAVGWRSLYANTTGPQNVAVGKGALAANTTGEANTGIGYLALTTNTTGQGEAFGANALTAQTTGSENQAFGLNALAACTTGTSNVAVGKGAFQALTTGSDSVAIGRGAGDAVTTAANNTFVGSAAGGSNTSGATNVAVGFQAATAVTTAGGTTAVGSEAGEAITTGAFNTCVGIVAGSTITTGARNLCLGYDSGTSGSPSHITTGDNGIVLGNNATASAHIKVDWTVTSDKRDKTDIEPLTMGLNFVNKLEPVTYRWDMRSDYSKDFSITPDGTHKQQKVSGGLLAQDVEKLEREYGYKVEDETAILTDKHNTNGNYGLTYSKFIPVLINAIQELSTQVETLKTKVETLKGE